MSMAKDKKKKTEENLLSLDKKTKKEQLSKLENNCSTSVKYPPPHTKKLLHSHPCWQGLGKEPSISPSPDYSKAILSLTSIVTEKVCGGLVKCLKW
jgi:hypothetical protein